MDSLLDAKDNGGVLRGIDPRVRIIAVTVFAVVVVGCHTLFALALGLAMSLGLLILARLPVGVMMQRMLAMDGFIVFILLMLPFTVPGDAIFSLWGFPASRQGLLQAVEIALKANAVVLALMTMVGTMSTVTLGHALHRLRLPDKFVHLLLFTVRYIDVLNDEYQRLRTAMKTRGFRPSTSMHTMRSFGYLIGMMLVRALERSERILAAMKCRGFVGQFPLFDTFCIETRDWLFGFAMFLSCIILLGVEVYNFTAH